MKRGFSLIEVIVSTVLLGVLGTIVVMFFVSSAQPLRQSQHREFAQVLASSQLDQSSKLSLGDHPLADVNADGIAYKTVVEVKDVPGYSGDDLRQITVKVSWSEKGRELSTSQQKMVSSVDY